jgi:molybdopterin biosynthesis enzyme
MASTQPTLVSVPDLLTILTAQARSVIPVQVRLSEAQNAILAEPLAVLAPVPDRPVALRAGFAVVSTDLVGISAYSPLVAPQAPSWVEVGEPLPPGADAVVRPDAVNVQASYTEILASVAPGENVRREGEDAREGAVLRDVGALLRSRDLVLAQAGAIDNVTVRRARIDLMVAANGWGMEAARRLFTVGGALTETTDLDLDGITSLAADLAVVVTSDRSLTDGILRRADRIIASGIALRPGETAQVVLIGSKPVIVVPPQWDGLWAVARSIVEPFVRFLTDRREAPRARRGRLERKLSSGIGWTELALLRTTENGLKPLGVGAFSLPAMAQADAWLAIPAGSEGYQRGDWIEALDLED